MHNATGVPEKLGSTHAPGQAQPNMSSKPSSTGLGAAPAVEDFFLSALLASSRWRGFSCHQNCTAMQASVSLAGPCACAVRTTAFAAASQPSRPEALLPQASRAAFRTSPSAITDITSEEQKSTNSSSPATQRHSRTFFMSALAWTGDFLEVLKGLPPMSLAAGSLKKLDGLCEPSSAKATSAEPSSATLKPASSSLARSFFVVCGSHRRMAAPSALQSSATEVPRLATHSCTQGWPDSLRACTKRPRVSSAPSVSDFIFARSIQSASNSS
mmetsp:Transcript_81409/g.212268  ORF Transcript_81409/g.212268 Transcript_81409/m.212268 type:complete len:271 (-) Transcript_81409:674-1486(-)